MLLQVLGHCGSIAGVTAGRERGELIPQNPQQQHGDLSLSTGTKILLSPVRVGGCWGTPGGSTQQGCKARRLRQLRLKAWNAFWIKKRDCFHLSSQKPLRQTEGEGAQAAGNCDTPAALSSLHRLRIRPPSDSSTQRFPE